MSDNRRFRRGGSLLPFYVVLAAVALIGAGVLAYAVWGAGAGRQTALRPLDTVELARLGDRALGDENAPLTVIEFADFQCGGCAVYAQREVPKIKNELVREGLVRLIFMDFPLPSHPHAKLAAQAGRCAHEQEAFWDYHDRIFAEHASWAITQNPREQFLEYAEALRLDRALFESCLTSDRHEETIEASRELGRSIGVRATPSIVVNGRLLEGVPTAEQLRALALEPRIDP